MEKIINFDNLRSFCYTNAHLVGEPKGIALSFFGLGGMSMYDEDPLEAKYLAEKGIIYVIPYYDPWCWMNRQAVAYTDEIVGVIAGHYGMSDPAVVSSGGSMGGLSSLVYAAYAEITPKAVVSNCPVCDLPYHFTERPDLPRTLYAAFGQYDGTMDEAMRSASPLHLALGGRMPDIGYRIFHCTADMAVNKEKHSDRLVSALRDAGRDVTYIPVEGRGHCDLTPEMRDRYLAYIAEEALNG